MSEHILITPANSITPLWRTDERLPDTVGRRIWTDCCGCKRPADETDCAFVSYFDYPLGGMGGEFVYGGDWEDEDYPTGAWFGGDWRVTCHAGFGCTVKPSMRNGRELREMWRWPA